MKKQVNKAIKWLKKQPVKGCITGSALLEYYPNQDVDIFVYDEKSFTKLFYTMYFNKKFTILDKLENWKVDKFTDDVAFNFHKSGLITIKFKYNTCVDVNIILKKSCTNIYGVLASFDLDIICVGYDLETKLTMDLSEHLPNRTATWNKHNVAFIRKDQWDIRRVLRQLERCFKYYNRNWETDSIVEKYIELIDEIQSLNNVFTTAESEEKLKTTKENTKVIKDICKIWLKTHKITEEELELLRLKIKEI